MRTLGDALSVCHPLGVEVFALDDELLAGWEQPRRAAYAGQHGMAGREWVDARPRLSPRAVRRVDRPTPSTPARNRSSVEVSTHDEVLHPSLDAQPTADSRPSDITTLGGLRAAGYRYCSLRDEIRTNLLAKLACR